ncbi:(4Fe-4S)-binding protein [Actinomycetospora atypica]|uniref:Ferredoxin n=1 Tax=Actinomycetospora atypica TaxID=1290095 RepID=A0ABV9YHK5_9PSEU
MKILADRDVCIGAGNCVLAAENVFDQDDDAVVVVLDEAPEGADAEKARNAVGSCPSGALSIEE